MERTPADEVLPETASDFLTWSGTLITLERAEHTRTIGDITRTGLTDDHDPLITSSLVHLSAASVCLEGQGFCPDLRTEMLQSARTAPTAASHAKLRHVQRFAEQTCRPNHDRGNLAVVGYIGLAYEDSSVSTQFHPHPSAIYPSPAGFDDIPYHHAIRIVQLRDGADYSEQQTRMDNYSMCEGTPIYAAAHLVPPLPARDDMHEILLPKPTDGHPTGQAFSCDSSLGLSYITRETLEFNGGRLAPWDLQDTYHVTGYDGQQLSYSTILPYVRIFFIDNHNSVVATRDIYDLPVVDKDPPLMRNSPGWAGSLGIDVLEWGLAHVHEEAVWYHGTGTKEDRCFGVWCLQPPDASLNLMVATTGLFSTKLRADHPRLSEYSQLCHKRAMGIHIAQSGLPYIVGMPSILGSFRIWLQASRQTQPVTCTFRGEEITRTVSLMRDFKNWSDGGLCFNRGTQAESLRAAMLSIQNMSSVLRAGLLAIHPPLLPYPRVTFEDALLGWWDHGIPSLEGTPYTCEEQVARFDTARPGPPRAPLQLMPLHNNLTLPNKEVSPTYWPHWWTIPEPNNWDLGALTLH